MPVDISPCDLHITHGSRAYRRTGIALFLAGFASFALIYAVQPLLPALALSFGLSATGSSLALSLTTATLAVSIFILGALSQSLGRKGLMAVSMIGAALINIAVGLVPGWHGVLALRALEGVVLGGVPAVAMAYLSEEISPRDLGRAMGLYVAGTAFGAMMGRLGMGLMLGWGDWRFAMIALGLCCMVAALGFIRLLPPSRHFRRAPNAGLATHLAAWRAHLRNPRLQRLYIIGFCLTAVLSTTFNYVTFRLTTAPFGLSARGVSLIFLTFAFGIVSSTVAGTLSDRIGRRPLLVTAFSTVLLGIGLTVLPSLPAICLGVGLISTGFFIGHSVASGAVGAAAQGNKGHAAALYLLIYYMGSSVIGTLGGWAWEHLGWNGVAAVTGGMALLALLVSAFGPKVAPTPDL